VPSLDRTKMAIAAAGHWLHSTGEDIAAVGRSLQAPGEAIVAAGLSLQATGAGGDEGIWMINAHNEHMNN